MKFLFHFIFYFIIFNWNLLTSVEIFDGVLYFLDDVTVLILMFISKKLQYLNLVVFFF